MKRIDRGRQSLLMGLLCLPVGLAVGYYLFGVGAADGWQAFPLYAAAAAFAAPTLTWWLMVERRSRFTIARSVWAGALGAALGHYLCWLFLMIDANVDYWLLGGSGSSLGEAPVDPLNALWAAGVYAAISYVVVGWVTIPAGAVLGLGCHYLTRNRAETGVS